MSQLLPSFLNNFGGTPTYIFMIFGNWKIGKKKLEPLKWPLVGTRVGMFLLTQPRKNYAPCRSEARFARNNIVDTCKTRRCYRLAIARRSLKDLMIVTIVRAPEGRQKWKWPQQNRGLHSHLPKRAETSPTRPRDSLRSVIREVTPVKESPRRAQVPAPVPTLRRDAWERRSSPSREPQE